VLHILMIGDVVGRPGRKAVQELLPGLLSEYHLDFIVANGENSAGGLGITIDTAQELLDCGINVITTGNHIWAKRDIIPYLDGNLPILRPLNYPPAVPGRGFLRIGNVTVVNLIGRVFLGEYDCPFRAMDCLLSGMGDIPKVIVVDFHAEATSEKVAMGRYLDGRVSAVLGTHTHVGTVDTCILPGGTAYVSDVGMVGPEDSVIGDDADAVLNSFLTRMPHRFSIGKGNAIFDAVVVEVNELNGRAVNIKRVRERGHGE
jgi:metallophosphoesterase (TIGR00282 family)